MREIRIALGILLSFFPALSPASTIIEVPAKSLPEIIGKEPGKIRVYSADQAGEVVPIPFQLENLKTISTTGLAQESLAVSRFSPESGILFRMQDLGSRMDASRWPSAMVRYEISADSQGRQVAYLTWEDNPSPLSGKKYLTYRVDSDQVETEAYQIGFAKGAPIIQDRLVIKQASQSQDILDRFKIRMILAIKNFFDFRIDEGEISSQVVGVETGPIRITRRVLASKKIGPIKLIPKSKLDFHFYPDWVEVVSQIINPVDGPKILEEKTTGVSGFDLNRSVLGSVFNSNLGDSFFFDGRPDASEVVLNKGKLSWWSMEGPIGAMVVQVKNDPKLALKGIELSFVLVDDVSRSDAPEGESGGVFLGFNLPYQRIPKGEFQIRALSVFPKGLISGQEEKILAGARVTAPQYVRPLP